MNYYLVSIVPRPGVTDEQVKDVLNMAADWYQFAKGHYVVYDDDNARMWRDFLGSLVEPGGQLFIVRLDMSDRAGWMKQRFWDWVRQPR